MRILRLLTAAVIAIHAVKSALPAGSTLAFKAGWLAATPDAQAYVPLMQATSWAQLAGWSVVIGLYLFAVLSLLTRNGRAFLTYVCAVVVDLAFFVQMKAAGVYDRTFSEPDRLLDLAQMGLLVAVAGVVWAVERRDRRRSGYA